MDFADSALDVQMYRGLCTPVGIVDIAAIALFETRRLNVSNTASHICLNSNTLWQIDSCLTDASANVHGIVLLRFAPQIHSQLAHAHLDVYTLERKILQVQARLSGAEVDVEVQWLLVVKAKIPLIFAG